MNLQQATTVLRTGGELIVDVLEGHRPVLTVTVTGVVDDIMGLSAYMNADALHDVMRESDVVTGALLVVDAEAEERLSRELKALPAVAGVGFKRAVLRNFRDVMAANMNLSIGINLVFAGIIAFGVVYNAARVSLSERSRELASLRVLGFTRGEISLILLGELAVLTLAALPAGAAFGYVLASLIVRSIESEVYRFPLHVSMQAVAQSCSARKTSRRAISPTNRPSLITGRRRTRWTIQRSVTRQIGSLMFTVINSRVMCWATVWFLTR